MTVSRSEIKRGLITISQPGLGIHLDRNDLDQLIFLRRFGENDRMADPRRTISLPRHQVTGDLSQLLSSLKGAGRIKVEERLARGSYSPRLSGNLVIRPEEEDATVLEIFKGVKHTTLKPLLGFQETYPHLLDSATVFPNLSGKGLKGITLQFNLDKKNWWQALAEHNWPFFRGLITTALPMDAEEFIDRSREILPKVISYGRANGALKHIRFYYSDDNRVFMAIAAGPSFKERSEISDELAKIHKPGRALHLMRSVEETCCNRRQSLAVSVNDVLGLSGCPEEVANTPFVMLNIENGLAVSGGVGPGSDFLPFTLGDGMIIHHNTTDDISPFGIKRPETGLPLPPFFSEEDVKSFIRTLQKPMVLHDLASGYHTTMD